VDEPTRTAESVVPAIPIFEGQAVVRRLGSNTMHLAYVEVDWIDLTKWIGPPYWALHGDTDARCGAVLKPDHRGLVLMQPGTKVTCRHCQRAGEGRCLSR
jgi:hypothetical protein